MTRPLPKRPSITSLKYQAKQILRSHRAGDRAACEVLRLHTRFREMTDGDILGSRVALMEVQHALALSYGFADWKALHDHVSAAANEHELSKDEVRTCLQRMLRHGRMRALPRRGRDRKVLLALAASQLADGESTEQEINRQLRLWLEPIADPYALDHLQVRRALVDHGLLHRTVGGASYWPDRARVTQILGESPDGDEPARILDAIVEDRAERKRTWSERG